MKKNSLFGIAIGIILVFSIMAYLFFNSSNWITSKDIEMNGRVYPNNTSVLPYRNYIVEFTVTKKKAGRGYLYPYVKGLMNPTFEENEASKIGGIGTGGDGYQSVIDELKKEKVLGVDENTEVWGFSCPDAPGTYKFKVYYDLIAGEQVSDESFIVYLNYEKKYGFNNYWTKSGTIKLEK